MRTYKVRKIANNWSRLKYDERLQKLSSIFNLSPDDKKIVFINDTYDRYIKQYYKKYGHFKKILETRNININYLINFIAEILNAILIVNDKANINNILITLNKYSLVYNEDKKISYYKKGNIYLKEIIINNEIYEFDKIINIIKTDIIYNNSIRTPIKCIKSFHAIRDRIITNTVDKVSTDLINYNKEYDKSAYDSSLTPMNNSYYYVKIQMLLKFGIFLNMYLISNQPAIYNFIDSVIDIKNYITPIVSDYVMLLDDSLSTMAIMMIIVVHIYHKTDIQINREHRLYKSFRSSKKLQYSKEYNYIILYVVYIFSIIFPIEYNTLTKNNVDVKSLFISIIKIYINNEKKRNINTSIFTLSRLKISQKDILNEKLINVFYRNPINVKSIKISGKKNILHRKNIIYISNKFKTNVINVEKSIPKGLVVKKINIPKRKIIKIVKSVEKREKLFSFVSKLRSHLSNKKYFLRDFEKRILNIGYLADKYTDEGGDIEKYKKFQLFINKILTKEWLIHIADMDKYNKNISLFSEFDKYIKDVKTAKTVYSFIDKSIKTYKNFDISRISIEREKMKLRELREYRTNIYYNLTPNEKLDIDRYEYGSDEWNIEIDARSDIYIDPYKKYEDVEF